MKKSLFLLMLPFVSLQAYSYSEPWQMFDRRLGMFIHWGVYSVGGYHEQEWMKKDMSKADYEKYLPQFSAEHFDPDKFIDVAESLGAEYIVITSKHHDGFCMWDTKTTDFNVMNTPCKRDVLKELSEACKRRNMQFGLYYSIPDWHHPNAYNKLSSHQLKSPNPGDEPDMDKYRAHVKAQIKELLTNYGEICCFFWDIPPNIDGPEMNALIRQLQPNIKINNRGWGNEGDYSTPERDFGDWANRKRPYTETCDSVGAQSWGYRVNEDYRTKAYLTKTIDRCLCDNSNYLLNIGPKSDGTLPEEAIKLFRTTGVWYKKVKPSFHGQILTDLVSDKNVKIIKNQNYLYLHYPEGLTQTGIDLYPLTTLPKEAILLNTGAKLTSEVAPMTYRSEPSLHIYDIPLDEIPDEPPIIRLNFPTIPESK